MYVLKNFMKTPFNLKFNQRHVRHVRTSKGSIKVGKELFQLTLDLKNFKQDELSVKAHQEYVIIEGKQNKKTVDGYVVTQFIRKYRLPERCVINKMESRLSPEGILTISVPRHCSVPDVANITNIPINPQFAIPESTKMESKLSDNSCATYPKVKPKK